MKPLAMFSILCAAAFTADAQLPIREPSSIRTTSDLRDLLLANKWSWRNVSAGVPDRELCVHARRDFLPPELHGALHDQGQLDRGTQPQGRRARGDAFYPDYLTFEVLDFDKKRRITGQRLPKQ